MTDVEIRPGTEDGFEELVRTTEAAFNAVPDPDEAAAERPLFEPERSLAAYVGGERVGAAWVYSVTMSLPGGTRPVAGVTGVGVSAVHRRRGVLTGLMRRQLDDIHERGREAVAVLWASEGAIYGRFGYGLATLRASLNLPRARAQLSRPAATGVGLHLAAPSELRAELAAVHAEVLPTRPGMLSRDAAWWDRRLADLPSRREGAAPLLALLASSADGRPSGYALYAVKPSWDGGGPDNEVRVLELVAARPEARDALWRVLLDLDLTSRTTCRSLPSDDPLFHLLAEPRRAQLTLYDGLWARLVDVPRALSERSYAAELGVTLDVADAVCPWNAGRYRLEAGPQGASCTRTDRSPDLGLSAAELGAVLLGGTSLRVLAEAGRVDEHTPGSLDAASRALRGDLAPWCPEIF